MAEEQPRSLAEYDALCEQLKVFTGRGFLRDQIDVFLKTQNRFLVLVGPPGIGKTALIDTLEAEHRGSALPYIAHYCGQPEGANPFVFCQNVSQQLQRMLGENYVLTETARQQQVTIKANVETGAVATGAQVTALKVQIGGMHPREAFRQLIREPLRAYSERIDANRENLRVVILIDAIDRAWDWDDGQGANLVNVLVDAQDLPSWVNIVCTARPGSAVQSLQNRAGVQVAVIDPLSDENLSDLRTYISQRLIGSMPLDKQIHVAEAVEGLPVAAHAAAQATRAIAEPETEAAGTEPPAEAADAEAASTEPEATAADAEEKALPATLDATHSAALARFIQGLVDASQGSFLFVHQYADVLATVVFNGNHEALPSLVRFGKDSQALTNAMDAVYKQVYDSISASLDSDPNDADTAVLGAIAVAYGPLSVAVINRVTSVREDAINDSLRRIEGLLSREPHTVNGETITYFSPYHRGFADFYRRIVLQETKTREWNIRFAQMLNDNDDNASVREYTVNYRWKHLQRGLRLQWPGAPDGLPSTAVLEPSVLYSGTTLMSVEDVQAKVGSPILQAQALRGLASQALAPEFANVAGSWHQATLYLQAARNALMQSRALRHRSHRRYSTSLPVEQIELEKTLTALGDTYVTIGQRMDPYIPRRSRPDGLLQHLHTLWDIFARLPITLFLTLVMLVRGARDLRFLEVLQNLGRGQDWTIARLYVFAVAAYSQAKRLAEEREDEEAADDISERLARLYTLMGAYSAAASTYSALMARPTALTRQWHQAVWRLELGEVLLSGDRFNQAVDMFTSARLLFESQETTVQLARTLSGLARGYSMQAAAADARGDTEMATLLYNQSLSHSELALREWQQLAPKSEKTANRKWQQLVPNTMLGLSDPNIGMSAVGHRLWEATQDSRLEVPQQQRARVLLDSINERHFPQRFEHPFLRLFRLVMAMLLPMYLIGGLLLSVQLPNEIRVQTSTDIAFYAPELDLTSFPDSVLNEGEIVPAQFDLALLDTLYNNPLRLEVGDKWLSLENLAQSTRLRELSNDVLFAGLSYYVSYLVVGLLLLAFASPARFQIYRPGRLVLSRDALYWQGIPGQHPVLNVWSWVRREIGLGIRRGSSAVEQTRYGSLIRNPWMQRVRDQSADGEQGTMLPLEQINTLISADLHVARYILYDFSYTIARPRKKEEYPELTIEGRMIYYRELCDELLRRLHQLQPTKSRQRPVYHRVYSIDLLRSGWGTLFALVIAFSALMLLMVRVSPDLSRQPLGLLEYSVSNLYVLVAPGLLLPLFWWFLARPMGILHARSLVRWPLLAVTMVSATFTTAMAASQLSLAGFGLKPDLTLPTIVIALLVVVGYYGRPQMVRAWPLNRSWLVGSAIVLIAAAGVSIIGFQLMRTIFWYDAVVRANNRMLRTFDDPDCENSDCLLLQEADRFYQRASWLAPEDSESYALRGQNALMRGKTNLAIDQFVLAMIYSPNTEQEAIQMANVATAKLLAARDDAEANKPIYSFNSALFRYRAALAKARPTYAKVKADCSDIGRLLVENSSTQPYMLRTPRVIDNEIERAILRQMADTCLNIGLDQLAEIDGPFDASREGKAAIAWANLAGASAIFQSVIVSAPDTYAREDARLGAAAAWLQMAQFERPPANMPDQKTSALIALRLYQSIQSDPQADISDSQVITGMMWSALRLGAPDLVRWDSAAPGLTAARQQYPRDPLFAQIQAVVRLYDSGQYPALEWPGRPASTFAALQESLYLTNIAVAEDTEELDQILLMRSMIHYSLREAQIGAGTADDFYAIWIQRALRDTDSAIEWAEQHDRSDEQIAGLQYWRGRLSLELATSWQRQARGNHTWDELVPLYSRAASDLSAAAALDGNRERRRAYEEYWLPLNQRLLANATHFALAYDALAANEPERAAAELALIDPDAVIDGDPTLAGVPEYSLLYGLTRLALGYDLAMPNDFVANASLGYNARASLEQALDDMQNNAYMPDPEARTRTYEAAAQQLAQLIDQQSNTLSSSDMGTAKDALDRLRSFEN